MAVSFRNVSAYRRLACSPRVTRVWCGIEPTRPPRTNVSFFKDQDPNTFSKSKNSGGVTQSPADLPARCQASVAVCPLPTRQAQESNEVETLDRAMEFNTILGTAVRAVTIDQHAAPLARSFLAESVSGHLVECCGRGSRPLYTSVYSKFEINLTGTSYQEPRAEVDNIAAKQAFEAAIYAAPGNAQLLSEFAIFTWKELGDVDAAEDLYNKALEVSPDDSTIQASHAQFLWQSDE